MNRRIGLIAIAVVLALVGALSVYSYAHNADKRAVDKVQSVNVLYAEKAIPVGTSWADAIKNSYLQEERVPVAAAPGNAIPNADAAIPAGQVATSQIGAGQIVVRQMFGERTSKTGILAIPKGMIAVSVSLPTNADVAGFVQNGSEVAIFHTFKVVLPKSAPASLRNLVSAGADLSETKMLLPRAQVIAVSQNAPSELNSGTGTTGSNVLVTLAVSQKDAERLILAASTTQLYLGLLTDTSVTAPGGGTLNTVRMRPAPISLD